LPVHLLPASRASNNFPLLQWIAKLVCFLRSNSTTKVVENKNNERLSWAAARGLMMCISTALDTFFSQITEHIQDIRPRSLAHSATLQHDLLVLD
jgi:hypothetical protein